MRGPLDQNVDLAAVVSRPADEFEAAREAIQERPEADTLHASTDSQALRLARRRRG
jgi:hypothetical protein